MDQSIVSIQSEYESLIARIKELQAKIVSLTALRDDLLYHVCPSLQAEYEEKIAGLERELLAAYMYLNMHRRTIENLQAQINMRRKKISLREAEEKAREEFRRQQEELKRKAEEAKKHSNAGDDTQGSSWEQTEEEAEQFGNDEQAAPEQESTTSKIKKLYRKVKQKRPYTLTCSARWWLRNVATEYVFSKQNILEMP